GRSRPWPKRASGVGTGEKVLVSCFICAMTRRTARAYLMAPRTVRSRARQREPVRVAHDADGDRLGSIPDRELVTWKPRHVQRGARRYGLRHHQRALVLLGE